MASYFQMLMSEGIRSSIIKPEGTACPLDLEYEGSETLQQPGGSCAIHVIHRAICLINVSRTAHWLLHSFKMKDNVPCVIHPTTCPHLLCSQNSTIFPPPKDDIARGDRLSILGMKDMICFGTPEVDV